jgi:Polyketide cyclase / dehydrase and lipid transport
MRYADTPTAEVEVTVHASPERVWVLVTDINVPARFSSEFAGAEWLGEGPCVGARFKGSNEHPAIGAWQTTSVVTRCEPGRLFEWAVGDPEHPSAMWRFELAPVDDGVRLRQWCQMGPAPSGLSIAIEAMPDKEERIVARRLDEFRANMLATVEGIKQLAEAPE